MKTSFDMMMFHLLAQLFRHLMITPDYS